MAVGMLLMAVSHGVPLLVAGSLTTSVGLGMFAAVDQALLLDVLPEKATEAGRFMGITGFATSIPQSAAPLIAPLFLAVGAGGGKNYTLLFAVAAGLVLLGGLVVTRIRTVR
jgi:MFS family permease